MTSGMIIFIIILASAIVLIRSMKSVNRTDYDQYVYRLVNQQLDGGNLAEDWWRIVGSSNTYSRELIGVYLAHIGDVDPKYLTLSKERASMLHDLFVRESRIVGDIVKVTFKTGIKIELTVHNIVLYEQFRYLITDRQFTDGVTATPPIKEESRYFD